MPNPVTYPGARTFVNGAVEAIQGAAATSVWTFPMESFMPHDDPRWIEDLSLYGDMAAVHNLVQGGIVTGFDFTGPYFGDGGPFFLRNILGDFTDDGTYTGSGTTTLAALAPAGQAFVSTNASIAATTVIAISSGQTNPEVRTVTSVTGAGPFQLNFTVPLAYAHASGQVVRPVTSPFTHVESLLNTAIAQPTSLTLIDWQGLTPTVQARAYTGCCLSELIISGSAESEFIKMAGKGIGWPSAPAAALATSTPTTASPIAAWRTLLGIAGPASGGTQVKQCSAFTVTIARQLKPEFTLQGLQTPFFVQRGNLRVTFQLTVPVPADETQLNYMLNNTQPQLQLVISNGLAGASLLSLQLDIQKGAYKATPIQKQEAMGYVITGEAVANTTNAGASGGQSPLKITTQNAVNQLY